MVILGSPAVAQPQSLCLNSAASPPGSVEGCLPPVATVISTPDGATLGPTSGTIGLLNDPAWTGAGGTLLWSTPANWNPATVPNNNTDVATFGNAIGAAGSAVAITVDGAFSLGALQFDAGLGQMLTLTDGGVAGRQLAFGGSSPLISLTGNMSATIDANVAFQGSGPATVSLSQNSLTFTAGHTLTINGNGLTFNSAAGGNVNVLSAITGQGPINVTGGGTVTLSGANTYTGGTVLGSAGVSGGVVVLGHDQAFGVYSNPATTATAGLVTAAGTSTIQTFANRTIQNRFVVNTGAALTFDIASGTALTFNGARSDGQGGAIDNSGSLTIGANAQFINSFSGGDQGGGVIRNRGTVVIGNAVVFDSNSQSQVQGFGGGAISNGQQGFSSMLTIGTGALFRNNMAAGGGGAIRNSNGATLTIGDNAVFVGNRSNGLGGAIENLATLTLTNPTFTNNTAGTRGGAISNSGTLTVTNPTFTNNRATTRGGAINNDSSTSVVNLFLTEDRTFTGNSLAGTTPGGFLTNDGTLRVDVAAGTTLTIGDAAATNRAVDSLTGTGTLNVTGPGVLVLNANSAAYTGAINVRAGRTLLGNAQATLGGVLTVGTATTTATFGGLGAVAGTSLTINNGSTLLIGLPDSTGAITAGTLTVNAATFRLLNGARLTGAGIMNGTAGAQLGSSSGDVVTADVASADALTVASALTGAGRLAKLGPGTLTLTGANTYTGATTVSAGTLLINGIQTAATGAVSVAAGATLGGAGTTGGSVTVADNGHLRGTPGQTFTMNALTLSPLSQVDVSLANPSTSAVFSINGNSGGAGAGNLVLDGSLNITAAGAFGPGVYRVMDYTGALTNNGLVFGTVPAGFTPNVDLFIQTSVAQQVNLVNAFGAGPLTFWDGVNSALFNNSVVNGGPGTWLAAPGNDAWTNSAGTVNAPWQGNGFAVFQGTPGQVTVNNASGAVTFSGAQFAVNGYAITGQPLTTTTAATIVRVGDGTSAGATMTAAISAAIQGTGGLDKTDLGTLVLTGANTYTGGTTVTGGILQIGDGIASGSLPGAVALGPSTQLALSPAVASALIVTSPISGDGLVRHSGPGTTILTGTNTYLGGTIIDAGRMQLGVNDSLPTGGTLIVGASGTFDLDGHNQTVGNFAGSAGGAITLGAGTLTAGASALTTFAGVISGTGGFVKQGPGTLTLSGVNSYTGGTTITAGTLQLGVSNSLTSSGALTVNAGTFDLNGNNQTIGNLIGAAGSAITLGAGTLTAGAGAPTTVASVISGTGGFVKQGAGTLTLTGANTYSGGTTISDGTLQIGNGVTSGSLPGAVVNNSALVFNPAVGSPLTGTGAITGSGSVTQAGPGVTVLTNAGNSYTGGTTIGGGTLQIGDGVSSGSLPGAVTNNSALVFAAGAGSPLTVAGAITGSGSVTQAGPGTTILTAANNYAGATTIAGGTLLINGNQTTARGAVSVAPGATLGGAGTTGGSVTVGDNGHLLGRPGQTFTMNALMLSPFSQVDISLPNPSASAFFSINGNGGAGAGNLVLDGSLNVTAAGAFGPGVYRVMDYTGTLTDNGLVFGTVPAGFTPNVDLFIQTSVAQQVNLVNAFGAGPLTFWDGVNTALFNNSVVNGGPGTWLAAPGNDAWTNSAGTVNAPWQGNGFAVFQGTPGQVAINNASGAVTFSGAQFAVNGYAITGQPLTTTTAATIVRVGDGTSAGATMTAAISAAIQGTGGLDKTDLGTLVLTGANTYTGGTTISAGTLQIGDGVTSGSLPGAVVNNSALVFNPAVGSPLTGAGAITGSGSVTQAGPGVTILTNAGNTYGGGTTIAAGTLQIGDGVTSGSLPGAVANQGLLILSPASGSPIIVGGTITGTGALTQSGPGTSILTNVANAYTGATTINAGTLQIGDGVTSGSLPGAVVNNSALLVNPGVASPLAIAGAITGSGSLTQAGPGRTILTNTGNTYSGGTSVIAGALQIGDGVTSGNLPGAVTNHGLLILSPASGSPIIVGGTITGTGALTQSGPGTSILTNVANAYAGGTTISAGTLQIGDGVTSGSLPGAVTNNGVLVLSPAPGNPLTLTGAISGSGAVIQASPGTSILSGSNSYTGTTSVSAGALLIDGNQTLATGAVSVASGATLSGVGTTGGAVTIADGGTLLGTQGATLTMNALTLNPASQVKVSLAVPSPVGLFDINANGGGLNGGNLVLAGQLHVSEVAPFGPGVYRVMTYSGTFTDQGMTLGTVPAGYTPGVNLFIETAVPQQVNLVNALGTTALNIWDGGNGALYDNGRINGGDGTWQSTPANRAWTEVTGSINGGWQTEAFAIFQATPGTVTVDNSTGPVTFGGLQFAASGYTITGQPLTTNTAHTILRVGDATVAGISMTGTIATVLQGTGGIDKTDLGSLVLTAANTYAGGTTISGGVLQLGNGGTSGSVLGNIVNNGVLAFNRSDDVIFDGQISGGGSLVQAGTGATILTSANPYSGGTIITGGELVATNLAALGTGAVSDNASLQLDIDAAHSGVFANRLFGSGSLTKTSAGEVILTAAGSSVGNVAVESGLLTLAQSGDFRTTAGGFTIGSGAAAALTTSATLQVATAFSVGDSGTLAVGIPTSPGGGPKVTAASADLGAHSTLEVSGFSVSGVAKASQLPGLQYTVIHTANGIAGDFGSVVFGDGIVPNYLTTTAGKDVTGRDYNLGVGLTWYEPAPRAHGTFTLGPAFEVDVPLVNVAPSPTFNWDGRSLTKTGPGTLTLSALNTYTGITGVLGGTVALAGAGDIAASAGVDLANAGTAFTIAPASGDRTIQDLFGVAGTTVALGTNTLTAGTVHSTIFAGSITGTGGLIKQGTGGLILRGTSPFTGATLVREGALIVGDSDHRDAALTGCALITVAPGAVFGGYGTVSCDVVNQGAALRAVGGAALPGVVAVGAPALGSDVASPAAAVSLANFQIDGTLTNGGVVLLGRPETIGDILTARSYVGVGDATIIVHTVLGSDDSPSDRVLINGGTATGATRLSFIPKGGGALTTGDGILIIDAINGATTTPTSFSTDTLSTPLYDYTLHRGGLAQSHPESWYLRSNYRAELSIDVSAAPLSHLYGQAVLDTLHERVGDEQRLEGRTDLRDSRWTNGAWGRVLARSGDWDGGGLTARGPAVDYDLFAFQGGADLYRRAHDEGGREHIGILGAAGHIDADVTSDAGDRAGDVSLDVQSVGGYWTHFGRSGWYVDGLAQISWLDATLTSSRTGLRTNGTSPAFSIEAGYPIGLGQQLVLEPQGQFIYQVVTLDAASDAFARIAFDDSTSARTRVGARLARAWKPQTPRASTTWARVNFWHEGDGENQIRVDDGTTVTPLGADLSGSWFDVGIGGDVALGRLFTVYGSGTYERDPDGNRHAWSGKGGFRLHW